ncbi:MAG: DUF167 domain-containing protein [Acidimicrobiales bacterium]|jgi:uncharacterized protein (TIGR00251 family)|nr:DUF167 domain-containing protein [Acidimicrobiales bacterium]
MSLPSWAIARDDGVDLLISVHPGARREGLVADADRLRVEVTAPPERGRATEAVIRLVADRLGVRRSAVVVVAGATSRSKRLRVDGVAAAAAVHALCGG